jgi:hypothetical protein
MLEKWNVGMVPFGPINACGGGREAPVLPPSDLTNNGMKCYYSIIPPFHSSIIPG